MYLTEAELEDSAALLRSVCAPGSVLALTNIQPGGTGTISLAARAAASAGPAAPRAARSAGLRAALAWWLRMLLITPQLWLVFLWLRWYAREPLRFVGWQPGALRGWLARRGWRLVQDSDLADVAAELGAPAAAVAKLRTGRMVAVAERAADDEATPAGEQRD
jgi:hypothetical protein